MWLVRRIVVAPPLIISETDIWELVTRLREALLDVSVDLNEARPPHGSHEAVEQRWG